MVLKAVLTILSVVIPAYNEEGAIKEVLTDWVRELDRLAISYEMLVYDDGSRDNTSGILQELSHDNQRIRVTSRANRGHGPTLLQGYHEARGDWVFQVDADGEMLPEGFEPLWSTRESYDFLFGYRTQRRSNWDRWLITRVSRWTVGSLFGKSCRDVNTPYRLMRRSELLKMLSAFPPDTFAPNLILAGMVCRRGLRVFEYPVKTVCRKTSKPSLVRWGLWTAAFRAFSQTLQLAHRERKGYE